MKSLPAYVLAAQLCGCAVPVPPAVTQPAPNAIDLNGKAATPEQVTPPPATTVTDPGPDWTKPCPVHGPGHTIAMEKLERLSARVKELRNGEDVRPVMEGVRELLESPCFDIGGRDSWAVHHPADPDTALSLKHSWDQAVNFLSGFLNLGGPAPTIYSVPKFQKTLAVETFEKESLASSMCPLKEPDCDSRTKPWELRAAHRYMMLWDSRSNDEWEFEKECLARIDAGSPGAFQEWRGCGDSSALGTYVLPPGGVRVPEQGWLVVRHGPWSYYGDCGQIWTIDLRTGWAQREETCRERVETEEGVEWVSKRMPVQRGFLVAPLVQEAVWSGIVSPFVERGYNNSRRVPEEIVPLAPKEGGHGSLWLGTSGGGCSHTDSLSWSWRVEEKKVATGSYISSGCASIENATVRNDYPRELFDVALESFQKASKAGPPPRGFPVGQR